MREQGEGGPERLQYWTGLGGLLRQTARALVDGDERWRLRQRLLHACGKLRTGFYLRPSHERLLRGGWHVLLVLDACRADVFLKQEPEAGAVRSMGRDTREWTEAFVARVLPRLGGKGLLLWFTANPVVDSALAEVGAKQVRTLRLWETEWAMHGPDGTIPSVHPERVNAAVRDYVAGHGQPERMIVQYLQPHSPFIGDFALPLTQWGELPDEFSRQAHALHSPVQAVREGAVTWDDVRAAYASNLRLVLGHARELAETLKGNIVITADHGELLGEGGRFGHDPTLTYKELYLVPWMEMDNGSFVPAPVAKDRSDGVQRTVLEDRLRALGYM